MNNAAMKMMQRLVNNGFAWALSASKVEALFEAAADNEIGPLNVAQFRGGFMVAFAAVEMK